MNARITVELAWYDPAVRALVVVLIIIISTFSLKISEESFLLSFIPDAFIY